MHGALQPAIATSTIHFRPTCHTAPELGTELDTVETPLYCTYNFQKSGGAATQFDYLSSSLLPWQYRPEIQAFRISPIRGGAQIPAGNAVLFAALAWTVPL